jgi:putative transposase
MANSYTQIHIQCVFAVSRRESLIKNPWKTDLFRYMTAIIQNKGHKVLAINGMTDHMHILFGMKPMQALADLMRDVKTISAKWINSKGYLHGKFEWQEGYGAFSYEKSALPTVIAYIDNQEEHHRYRTFQEEYQDLLQEFAVSYDEKYLFHQPQ